MAPPARGVLREPTVRLLMGIDPDPGSLMPRSVCRAIAILKERGYVKGGQQVAIVQSGRKPIWRQASTHHIQVGCTRTACPALPCRHLALAVQSWAPMQAYTVAIREFCHAWSNLPGCELRVHSSLHGGRLCMVSSSTSRCWCCRCAECQATLFLSPPTAMLEGEPQAQMPAENLHPISRRTRAWLTAVMCMLEDVRLQAIIRLHL